MGVWTIIGVIILLIIILIVIGVVIFVKKVGGLFKIKDSYIVETSGGLTCGSGYDQPDGIGGLCYPRCRDGFHAFGCCVCSPNCPAGRHDTGTGCAKKGCAESCPSGFNDIGCFCQKPASYGRGAGELPKVCPENETQSGLLCYPACRKGYSNTAGVCWQD